MSTHCIVVADENRARLFSLRRSPSEPVQFISETNSLPYDQEHIPEQAPRHETRNAVHPLNPPRDCAQSSEFWARCYRMTATRARRFAEAIQADHLVLVAEPGILDGLKRAFESGWAARPRTDELPKNLTGQTAQEIIQHLRRLHLLDELAENQRMVG